MAIMLILISLVLMPLYSKHINSAIYLRLVFSTFIIAAAVSVHHLALTLIGLGFTMYGGLFHISSIVTIIDPFIFIVASLLVFIWKKAPLNTVKMFNQQLENSNIKKDKVNSINKSLLELNMYNWNISLNEKNLIIPRVWEYGLILLFIVIGASFLVSGSDLISLFLSIELQSYAAYILSSMYRNNQTATAGGLKYFLLGALASSFILLGSALIYGYSGITNLENLFGYLENSIITELGVILGFFFIACGFLIKISSAPFHQWSPDVYDGVPTVVTVWLAVLPKISIIILLFYLSSVANLLDITKIINLTQNYPEVLNLNGLNFIISSSIDILSYTIVNSWKGLLIICSIFSLIIGTILGLSQSRIKRLLAYSTVSHVGFMLLVLAYNTFDSTKALFFYLFQYSLTNANAFIILLAIGYIINKGYYYLNSEESNNLKEKQVSTNQSELFINAIDIEPMDDKIKTIKNNMIDVELMSELKGIFYKYPILSWSLIICLFSIAGIPPLIGFFAKYFVLYSSIISQYYFLALIAILTSVISASYYLKLIAIIHFDQEEVENNLNKVSSSKLTSNGNTQLLTKTDLNQYNTSEVSINNASWALSIDNDPVNFKNSNPSLYVDSTKKGNYFNFVLTHTQSFIIAVLTLFILFFILQPSVYLKTIELASLYLYYD